MLQKTLVINEKELCKYFKPGDHVRVVSGAREGAPGMVVKVEGHVLTILSDKTKEDASFLKKNYCRYLNVVDSGLLNITFHVYLPL